MFETRTILFAIGRFFYGVCCTPQIERYCKALSVTDFDNLGNIYKDINLVVCGVRLFVLSLQKINQNNLIIKKHKK